MTYRCEALALGVGNVLWADEGFGVRAIEALHAAYAFPDSVALQDGGTQGIYLFGAIASARRQRRGQRATRRARRRVALPGRRHREPRLHVTDAARP